MDNELDEGMVEKAGAAFEAMTKAMLDAGRRYEERTTAALSAALNADRTATEETCDHDYDDGLGMLTARDIPTPDRPVEPDPAMVEAVIAALIGYDTDRAETLGEMADRRARWAPQLLSAANVPGLVAQVERLRYDLDHSYSQREWSALTARATSAEQERDEFERRYATVLRNLNVAQQELADLRAGIEALAGDPTAQDETGTWIDRKRVADLLAGSGEPLGCPCYDTGGNYGVCAEHAEDPTPVHEHGDWDQGGYCNRLVVDANGDGDVCGYRRPGQDTERCGAWGGCTLPRGHNRGRADVPSNHSVPDSPDVYETIRAFIEEEVGFDGGPGMDDQARRLTDRVLAVVGQGVTAEQAWDEGYLAAIRDVTPNAPLGGVNPYRAVVRSGEQEGE